MEVGALRTCIPSQLIGWVSVTGSHLTSGDSRKCSHLLGGHVPTHILGGISVTQREQRFWALVFSVPQVTPLTTLSHTKYFSGPEGGTWLFHQVPVQLPSYSKLLHGRPPGVLSPAPTESSITVRTRPLREGRTCRPQLHWFPNGKSVLSR